MKIIKVKTDSKNYDIKVGHDLIGSTPLKKLVSQKDILLIVDKKVPELLINKLKNNLKKVFFKKKSIQLKSMPLKIIKTCHTLLRCMTF